jgi:predicted nucleic acid-binding protein
MTPKYLMDTSVLINVLQDKSGAALDALFSEIGDEEYALCQPVEMEFLAGARNEQDWLKLRALTAEKIIFEFQPGTWINSARTYFELRRSGLTIRKLFDCCIAQVALERDLILIHNDRDFDAIATVRPLKHIRLPLDKASP